MPRRVTMRDVAEASGVSTATVSFVLNNTSSQTISADTREKVQRAADELGYVPHGIARALREGTSRIVVLNVDARFEGHYTDTFVAGLGAELAEHDHVLLVKHGEPSEVATRQVLDSISPRAFIQFAENYTDGRELEDGGWVDGMAANVAAQIGHLAHHGHARLAMALTDNGSPLAPVRLGFAREAARRLGLPRVRSTVVPEPREAGVRTLRKLLDRSDVTAIAAFDDRIALRVLAAAHDLGIDVPGELAVIGFDATEAGALASPALTSVHIDAVAHGRRAARIALGMGYEDIEAEPGRVVVRESA